MDTTKMSHAILLDDREPSIRLSIVLLSLAPSLGRAEKGFGGGSFEARDQPYGR
jgi:hypothetical protein